MSILSPLIIVPLVSLSQFFIWLFLFDSLKNVVPGVEGVQFYLSPTPLLRYIVLFSLFYASMIIGSMVHKSHNSAMASSQNLNNIAVAKYKNIIILFCDLLLILVIVSESIAFYAMRDLLMQPKVLFSMGQGTAVLAQLTTQNEGNISRTFYNFLPIIIGVYSFLLLANSTGVQKKRRNGLKARLFLCFVIAVGLFFRAARQLSLVLFVVWFVIYAKYKLSLKKRIKIRTILLILLIVFSLAIFSEVLRFGVLNSVQKGIGLFSGENLFDVFRYFLCAYVAKNVNNAMIILDSKPTYGMFSTGSQLIYNFILRTVSPSSFTPATYIGPHGTVDFIGLIWIDWGLGSFVILPFIGFFVGLAYRNFISSSKDLFWDVLYAIIYPGLFSNIRINYFFLHMFIYPFLALVLLQLIMTAAGGIHYESTLMRDN